MQSGRCSLLGRADLTTQLVQGFGGAGGGERGEEPVFFVAYVLAHLELQLRYQVVELRVVRAQALQVLEVLFHLCVIGEPNLAAVLGRLADTADQAGGPRATYDRYGVSLQVEQAAAEESGWADGRSFRFCRSLAVRPELVWHHLTEAPLLARWWTSDDLRVSELVFEAREGGRIVQEYRDAEDTDGSDLVAGRAGGVVDDVRPVERLAYRLLPLLPDGGLAFTAHVDLSLRPTDTGTDLNIHWRITDSTIDSADLIAGIEIGFGQSLDKLAATLVADSHDTVATDTRSTK